MGLSSLVNECARRRPGALAATDGCTALTWSEVRGLAMLVRTRLGDLAVGRRIAVCGDPGIRSLSYAVGIMEAGGTVAFLASATMGRTHRALELWQADAWIDVEPAIDDQVIDGELAAIVAQLLARAGAGTDTGTGTERAPQPGRAIVFSTSGSTGDPKLVSCPDDTVAAVSRTIAAVLGLRRSDVILSASPPHFDYGFNQLTLSAASGAAVVYYSDFLHLAGFTTGAHPPVTVLATAPSQLRLIAGMPEARVASRSVRMLTSTGAPFPVETTETLRQLWPFGEIRSMYGMTECKRVAISTHDEFMADQSTVGRPIPGVSVRITPETGEILVRTPYLMDLAPTTATIGPRLVDVDGETLLATGDTGRLSPDGRLQVTGRLGQFVKIADVRVSLAECEAVAVRHPLVRDAAAVAEGDGLAVWCEPVATCDESTLREDIRRRLVDWTGVARLMGTPVHTIESLPRLPNGKVDRAGLAGALHRV